MKDRASLQGIADRYKVKYADLWGYQILFFDDRQHAARDFPMSDEALACQFAQYCRNKNTGLDKLEYVRGRGPATDQPKAPPASRPPSKKPDARSPRLHLTLTELEADVSTLRELGLLRKFAVEMNEAYVEPLLWSASDIDTKKGIAITLADYCALKGSTGRITILDYRSGKKLAKFGSWGWKVY